MNHLSTRWNFGNLTESVRKACENVTPLNIRELIKSRQEQP
jgi:hypothetical protein